MANGYSPAFCFVGMTTLYWDSYQAAGCSARQSSSRMPISMSVQ